MGYKSAEDRRAYHRKYAAKHKRTRKWKDMKRGIARRQRHTKKKAIIEALGGKCLRCGFNEHMYGLEFDHIRPEDKKSRRKDSPSYFISSQSKEEAMDYITKNCQLLCANCHALKTVAYADNLRGKAVSDTSDERTLYESKLV